jgi:HTH-type transcriptional regulator/antitoxin HigA
METIVEPSIPTTKAVTHIIKSHEEYRELVEEAKQLSMLDPDDNTPEADRLELLALLITDYQDKHFKFEATDAVDAIEFRMDQQGLKPKDLIPYLGSRSKVSEVLSRKRPLSLKMIRALHEGLGIPLDSLIR